MATYTYQAVTYNSVKGFIATRRIDGVFAGNQFGRTKLEAKTLFDSDC